MMLAAKCSVETRAIETGRAEIATMATPASDFAGRTTRQAKSLEPLSFRRLVRVNQMMILKKYWNESARGTVDAGPG
jgi:uncharacterized ferritin-like protein (DUF455 family)